MDELRQKPQEVKKEKQTNKPLYNDTGSGQKLTAQKLARQVALRTQAH